MTGAEPLLDATPHRGGWYRAARDAVRTHAVATGLFAGLVVLNLVDLATTRMVLDRGGEEGNPVMAPIIDNVLGALAVKVLCLALIGVLIAKSRRSTRMLFVVAAVDVWYLAVIGWNLHVLRLIA